MSQPSISLLAKPVATHVSPDTIFRVLRTADFADTRAWLPR
ncbi:hypothetical protein OH799_23140 [Nocardia sp. NBC_00881]|nr:hypothetical protein OH799_23140 [Nocardia sp. NBC_00881]